MDMLSLISLDRKRVSIGDKKDNSGMRTDSEKKKKTCGDTVDFTSSHHT